MRSRLSRDMLLAEMRRCVVSHPRGDELLRELESRLPAGEPLATQWPAWIAPSAFILRRSGDGDPTIVARGMPEGQNPEWTESFDLSGGYDLVLNVRGRNVIAHFVANGRFRLWIGG